MLEMNLMLKLKFYLSLQLTAKKIWDSEDNKEDKFIGDHGMWRNSTWSTHAGRFSKHFEKKNVS